MVLRVLVQSRLPGRGGFVPLAFAGQAIAAMYIRQSCAPVLPGQVDRDQFLVRRDASGHLLGTVGHQSLKCALSVEHLAALERAGDLPGVADFAAGNVDQLHGQRHGRRIGQRRARSWLVGHDLPGHEAIDLGMAGRLNDAAFIKLRASERSRLDPRKLALIDQRVVPFFGQAGGQRGASFAARLALADKIDNGEPVDAGDINLGRPQDHDAGLRRAARGGEGNERK